MRGDNRYGDGAARRAPAAAKRPARWVTVLLLGVAVLSACDAVRATGPAFEADGFAIHARAGHLVLRNHSPATIHYVALEEETSALVDLHFDPTQWPSVAPGGEVRIPYGELMGYRTGARQARVYWWTEGRYPPHAVVDLR